MSRPRVRRIVLFAGTGTAGPQPEEHPVNATVSTVRRPAGARTDPQDALRSALPGAAEPSGAVVVEHLDGEEVTVVAFWPDEHSAADGARVYRIDDRMDGVAAGRSPLFAQVTWLNGTGDPAVAQAAERGGRDRIYPAVRDVDGLVGVVVLRSGDDRVVVLALATARETHAEIQDRITRTHLLPGEDPALLPGPDRMELGRVLLARVPTEVRS